MKYGYEIILKEKWRLRHKFRKNEIRISQLQAENSRVMMQMESLIMSLQAYHTEKRLSKKQKVGSVD